MCWIPVHFQVYTFTEKLCLQKLPNLLHNWVWLLATLRTQWGKSFFHFSFSLCAGLLGVPSCSAVGCHLWGLEVTQAGTCYNCCYMKTQPNPSEMRSLGHFKKYRPRYRNTCSSLEKSFMYFHLPSWQTSCLSLTAVFLHWLCFFFSCPNVRDAPSIRSCSFHHFPQAWPSSVTNWKLRNCGLTVLNSVHEEQQEWLLTRTMQSQQGQGGWLPKAEHSSRKGTHSPRFPTKQMTEKGLIWISSADPSKCNLLK